MDLATKKVDPQASSVGQVQGVLDSAPGLAHPLQAKRRLGAVGWSSLSLLLLLLPTGSHGHNILYQVCGKRTLRHRVPSNENTWEGKWPWQVSIQYGRHYLCSGTLIDFQWVLTASHCFYTINDPTAYHALVGSSYKLYEKSPKSIRVGVKKIFRHPNFAKVQPFHHDIALLLLEHPVRLSHYVMPVCMPRPDLNLEGKASCWMTGWERVTNTVPLVKASPLQDVQLPLIKNSECNALFTSRANSRSNTTVYEIKDDMLCLGNFSDPRAICLGGAGSPLVCKFSKIWIQVAMVSWSTQCSPTYVTIFTRILPYMHWIEKIQRTTFLFTREAAWNKQGRRNMSWPGSASSASFPTLLVPLQILFLHWLLCLGLPLAP